MKNADYTRTETTGFRPWSPFIDPNIMHIMCYKIPLQMNIEENAKILAISTINQIDAVLSVSQQIPEDLACVLEYGQIPNDRIKELLKNIVENSNEIYGSTISFEPYMFERDRYFWGPYFFKPEGKIKFSDLGTQDYNYLNWEWYTSPKSLNKGV